MSTPSSELRNRKKGEDIDFDDEDLWQSPKEPIRKSVDTSSPFNILQVGCVSVLQVGLNENEVVKAESNALVTALPAAVKITASTSGGVFQAASRALAGESFFLQEMKAKQDGVLLELAPKAFHGLAEIHLQDGEKYYVRKDGFFASQPGVECVGTIAGAREFMAQSLALLQVSGNGWFVVEAFGGVKQLFVPKGKTAIVDNSHLVAWPVDADYSLRQASASVMDSIMSGEWVVLKFKGPCTLYVSYARESTAEDRVGSNQPRQRQHQSTTGLAGNLAGVAGNYLGTNGFASMNLEGAVQGAFRGFAMIIIVLFFLFVMLPRLFF